MDKGGPYFFLIGVSIPLVFPRYLFIYFSRHTNGIRKKTRLKNYMPLHVTYRRERESLEGVFPKMCLINSPVTFGGWIGSRTSIIATTKRRRKKQFTTKCEGWIKITTPFWCLLVLIGCYLCVTLSLSTYLLFLFLTIVYTRLQQYYTQCLLESRYYFVVLSFFSFFWLTFSFSRFQMRKRRWWLNCDKYRFVFFFLLLLTLLFWTFLFFLWLFSLLYNDSRDRFDCYGGDGLTR